MSVSWEALCEDPDGPTQEEQAELYALYKRAQRRDCECFVCRRLRAKAWDDQNDLIAGQL